MKKSKSQPKKPRKYKRRKKYTLIIPRVPASFNHTMDDYTSNARNRRNSSKQIQRYKKRWERIVMSAARNAELPNFSDYKCEIKFIFYHPVNRKRDHDNYFMAMKAMIDGLFEDDDSEVLKTNFPIFRKDPKNPRTEIIIYKGEEVDYDEDFDSF